MADEIVTREQLVNASLDADSLGQFISGPDSEDVVTRLGQQYPTLSKAVKKVENIGGLISAPTLTALNAIVPTYNFQVGQDDSTGNQYRWDPTATPTPKWVATGRNFTQDFQNFANANGMFKPKTYAAGVDFNTLTAYGTHTFLTGSAWDNSTNRPNRTAQYGQVLVLPTTANIITQIAIMGNNTKSFAMRLRNDLLVWQDWLYFYSYDETISLIKADFNSFLKPLKTSSTVNLLDPAQVIQNFEVRPDGTILASATGAISGLIYCYNKEYLYVSGLQANTAPRYYRFLDQNGIFISGGYLNNNIVEGLVAVPANAYSFQISLKQGNSNPLDISTAQIEFGKAKTTYVAFAAGAITHLNQVPLADTPIQFNSTSSSKNLFDKSAVLNGYEVYNDGRILVQATSITSPVIDVTGLSNITISGLVQNPELVRYCVFKNSAGTVLSVVQIAQTSTQATFAVPANATTFQFSIKQRSASTPDLNIVQVESGTNATAYTAFVRGISAINGLQIVSRSSGGTSSGLVSRAIGARAVYAGDSRVQTGDVDNGDITGTTFRSNYPKYQKDTLKLSDYKNYARSGASFAEYTGQLTWQKLRHQVQTAIDNAENPNFFMLDAGTNDMNWARSNAAAEIPIDTLGSYETAMGKPIADLDFTKTAEAMRWCLFKIREAFPNAVCFYATQTQRADTDPVYQEISNNIMVKLARRYGFTIIDGLYGLEIIKDFETWGANGRYLSDGLHPNLAGQQAMNNFYTSEIIRRMTY
jgi:lysophospholipase L1-like esterase